MERENSPSLPFIEVGVAAVVRGGTVLVCQRLAGSKWAGWWEFPGGKIEPDETPDACVVRELAEELGIEVGVVAALPIVEHRYETAIIRLHPRICRLKSGEPRAIEVEWFEWRTVESLAELKMLPANGPVVAALREFLAETGKA